jgi:hypothetical protein
MWKQGGTGPQRKPKKCISYYIYVRKYYKLVRFNSEKNIKIS